jgi:hypothetical protein
VTIASRAPIWRALVAATSGARAASCRCRACAQRGLRAGAVAVTLTVRLASRSRRRAPDDGHQRVPGDRRRGVFPDELRRRARPDGRGPIRDAMADLLRARKTTTPIDPSNPPLHDPLTRA